MAKKKMAAERAAYTVFNVVYEDGTVTSYRRVPKTELDESFGDALLDLARIAIEKQDNEIAQRSGRQRAKIKSVVVA